MNDFTKIPGARLTVEVYDPKSRFRDTLHIPFGEIEALSQKQLEDMVMARSVERIENHKAFVIEQSKKPPYIPTKEELIARKKELDKQVTDIQAAIVAIEAKEEPIKEEKP